MTEYEHYKTKTGRRLAILRLAELLTTLGARPPFVKKLLPALGTRTIRRLYRDTRGYPPRPGKWMSSSTSWLQGRGDRRLEVAFFYRTSWRSLAKLSEPAELATFLLAYHSHVRHCRHLGVRPSPIERLWQFLRHVEEGTACVVSCEHCAASYVVDIPVNHDRFMSCPYCRHWVRHQLISRRKS